MCGFKVVRMKGWLVRMESIGKFELQTQHFIGIGGGFGEERREKSVRVLYICGKRKKALALR